MKNLYDMKDLSSVFVPENMVEDQKRVYQSVPPKYTLTIVPYSTGPGKWSYTRGTVTKDRDGKIIAIIDRNYSSFPFKFILSHRNGHDYLVCGSDYQGQTVIELDTGLRRDALSEGAEEGFGFCWTSYELCGDILVVDGCHWACPYEFRFFDFSDPMSGWPEIKPAEYVDADHRQPTFDADGIMTTYQSAEPDDDDDETESKPGEILSYRRHKREGLAFVEIENWVSDKEQDRRRRNEEARKQYNEWWTAFKATDELFLTMLKELEGSTILSPEDHMGVGVIYDQWCKDYPATDPRERRICKRIHDRNKLKQDDITLDLEWGADKAPIKLVVFVGGNSSESRFYDHSVSGMSQAFSDARELVLASRLKQANQS